MMSRYCNSLSGTVLRKLPAWEDPESASKHTQAVLWHFLLPAAIYLLLALLYLFAIPTGESPDEPGHLQCIEQVAQYNRLPVTAPAPQGEFWWSHGRIVAGHMCYHMPLYYVMAGYMVRKVAEVTGTAVTYAFPPTNERFGPEVAMFVHDKPYFWQTTEPITLTTLRLLSIVLGLALVWASYVLARRLVPGWPLVAVLAAVLSAGWPQIAYLSRAITNDALATAVAVLVLVILAQVGRPSRFVALALLSSLAILSKVTVAFVAVVVLAVWFLEFRWFPEERKGYLQALGMSMVIWSGTALLLFYHPLLNHHLAISRGAFSGISEQAGSLTYWQEVLATTLSSGWARLAWMNLPAPLWHAYVWWSMAVATMVIGFTFIWRMAKTERQQTLLLICLLWVAGTLLSYLRINANRFQPQFRFMLVMAPILTAGMASGYLYGARQRPLLQWAIILLVAFLLVAYNLWFIFTAVQDAYGWRL